MGLARAVILVSFFVCLLAPLGPARAADSFSHNLTPGVTDADVVRLQAYLNAHGFVVAPTGPFKAGVANEDTVRGSFNSYLGVLSHANAHELTEDFKNHFCFWTSEE